MKWLWLVSLVALAALLWGMVQGHRAGKAEATRDSALAVSALLKTQAAQLAAAAESANTHAALVSRHADSLGHRAAQLEALARHPLVIPPPDTTLRDSLRFWEATSQDLTTRLLAASQALDARGVQVGDLLVALDSQRVATARFRASYEASAARAQTLEAALRTMPTGCRKFMSVPIPRVGVGAALTQHGIAPALALIIPLGC